MIGGKKKCIGLIFGGHSNEHEVSISSAKTVFQAFNAQINKERFTVKAFYINKYGDWLDSDISEKILIGEIENNKTKKQEIFDQEKINFYSVSVGNPHAIIFAQEISTIRMDALAQSLIEENCFKNGFNLNLAEISSNNSIKLRVHERGVGETEACGSGACATALAATLFKEMQHDIEIIFEKGTLNLKIDLDSNKIYLSGTTSYLN